MKNKFLPFILLLMFLAFGCKKNESITSPAVSPGQWKIVYNADTLHHYSAISFPDALNGWAVGDSGTILHTTNGGSSWNIQQSGTSNSLSCIYFLNSQKGWVGADNNSIGITIDGGNTWFWKHPAGEPLRTFMSMSFVNEHSGWIVDNYAGILHTEDGGFTWTPQINSTRWAITSVQFLDENEGWASATNRVILHTTDGGLNWKSQILDSLHLYGETVVYNKIYFYNHTKGWVGTVSVSCIATATAPIVCTTDTGNTWKCQPTKDEFISSIQFVNENEGWAAGINGILHTTDGGMNWNYQLELHSGLFADLHFVDRSHGWAVTFTGSIYKYE